LSAAIGRVFAREFAREQATRERTPRHDGQILIARERYDFAFDVAAGHRVVHLQALEARKILLVRDPQRLGDLPGRQIAQPEVAHFSRTHAVVQCIEGFLERREWIAAMNLVKVDVIDLQALEARIHALHDV
jgi:hypothetical protein